MVGALRRLLSRGLLRQIVTLEQRYESFSPNELADESRSLRFRAQSGEKLRNLLPEAYALVREAAWRSLGMRHYPVQLLGGILLFHRAAVEMETGEGKTLTATLPLYLASLVGRGAHLATVNDYLAQRDAQWMEPVYRQLGMSVGCVQSDMPPEQRRAAYACDLTYGTAKEFGFDFLRDRLQSRFVHEAQSIATGSHSNRASLLQRQPFFAIVDEADSILIDEARTPLILSALPEPEEAETAEAYSWAASKAQLFLEQEHYRYDSAKKTVALNAAGREVARALDRPSSVNRLGVLDVYRFVERSVRVNRDFQRDVHYVVRDDEIVIVDEFTGRLGEGRRWQDGLHQAVEAREGVPVQAASKHAARITIQDYFLRYPRLAGMTGSTDGELRRVYRLVPVRIPTNRPVQRRFLSPRKFRDKKSKREAIVEEVRQLHAANRPVLIGTRTIEQSEHLSQELAVVDIPHRLLNAHRHAEEAEIVAQAGQPGSVTVSTNMAGRGTDIVLGEGVAEAGGLVVIATELHESARIDKQLAGRCARQGDPGEFRQFLSLEDEVLVSAIGDERARRIVKSSLGRTGLPLGVQRRLAKAQRRVERRHARQRAVLLHHEKERRKLQRELGLDPYLDTAE